MKIKSFCLVLLAIVMLPLYSNANDNQDVQPMQINIEQCEGKCRFVLDGREMTPGEIGHKVRERFEKMGEFPVLIRAGYTVPHASVAKVMDACTSNGISKISFMAILDKKEGTGRARALKHDALCANGGDEAVTIKIERACSANGKIICNNREMLLPELRSFLKTISEKSAKTPIAIRCTENSPHQTFVDVLDACYQSKLFNVSTFAL